MPDQRRHRGPHPEDEVLFARSKWPDIRMATSHLSWLLSRGYAITSAVKLVGDRFALDARQRIAIQRSACSDEALRRRAKHQARSKDLAGRPVDIDGFNILTTVEAGLAGGVLLRGRDGCLRDMASMHGSYRRVEETLPALEIIGETLEPLQPSGCTWWLDRPVSNSGRVSALIQEVAARRAWPWSTRLTPDPDPHLIDSSHIVITADSVILDRTSDWFNLAPLIFLDGDLSAWVVPADGVD